MLRVIPFLTVVLFAASGLLFLWGLVQALRNRPAGKPILIYTGVLEALLLIQLIVGAVLFPTHPGTDGVLFFGYLLTAIVMLPLAWFWAFAELSRWGPAVLAAAGFTVVVMIERMVQLWV